MAKNFLALAREADKKRKALEKARKHLARVKAQKRPRTKTLEAARTAVTNAKASYDAAMALMSSEGERAPNPEPAPGAPTPAPEGEGDAVPSPAAVEQVVEQMMVNAVHDFAARVDEALDLLVSAPTSNPHVRGYTRSSRVRPHERGNSRFFGPGSGYTESGR